MTSRPARRPPLRGGGARPPGAPGQDRFGLLLVVLVVTYVLSAFTTGRWVAGLQIVLFVTAALLALRSARVTRRTAQLVIAVGAGGSVIALTLTLTSPAMAATGGALLWTALVLLFTVVVIVGQVLAYPVVTLQSIYGALSAYILIGLMFAAIYSAISKFGGGHFFQPGEVTSIKTFQYFSFTTLTTLGYGDYTAAGSGGQAVAVMEAVAGQIFLATLVARLVAAFRPGERDTRRAGGTRGRVPPSGEARRAKLRELARLLARRPGPGGVSARRAAGTRSPARERPARR